MYGYQGRIALIDVTTGGVQDLQVSNDERRKFIGGRGLASKLLIDLLPPGADPLGPDNVVIFAVGPLNGTLIPASSRWSVAAKSPLTGYLGSGNAGGQWGPELKWAGFDAVAIRGVSEKPCFIYLHDGEVDVLPAEGIWGKTTWEAEEIIRDMLGDPGAKVVSIGKAGENRVPIATVIGDKTHSGGRGGVGAVLGSKNVKAVAVRGRGGVKVHDPEGLLALAQEMLQYVSNEPAFETYYKYGSTTALAGRYEKIGGIPAYNFQRGVFPHLRDIDHVALSSKYNLAAKSCVSCPIACWHTYAVPRGKYAGTIGAGVQASTLLGFGCRCGIGDLDFVLTAQTLVDQYGLDTISTEAVIAFAMECRERGLLDTGDLDLEWGNGEAVLRLIHEIAEARPGLGALLGKGCHTMARELGGGAEAFAPCVKGLEMTAVDVRAVKSWGVAYAVSGRGADHMRAYAMVEFGEFPKELLVQEAGSPEVLEIRGVRGKGKAVALFEDLRALSDSLELCKFLARGPYALPENVARMLEVVTGLKLSPEEVRTSGERIVNLERLFNLREGLLPEEDTLPRRMLNQPLPDGPAKGEVCELEPMLEEYYAARGWDRSTGWPLPEKLSSLGLDQLVYKGE